MFNTAMQLEGKHTLMNQFLKAHMQKTTPEQHMRISVRNNFYKKKHGTVLFSCLMNLAMFF